MKRVHGFGWAFAVVFAALSASAGLTEVLLAQRDGYGTPVKPGRWHAGLAECRAYAEANGLPLIAVWSRGDACPHCVKLEGNMLDENFTIWQQDSGIVFCFSWGDGVGVGDPYPDGWPASGGLNGSTMQWCCKGDVRTFPFCRFYWKKNGVTLVDEWMEGDSWDGGYGQSFSTGRYDMGSALMVEKAKALFAGYVPQSVDKGGTFVFLDDENAGLKCEVGKTGRVYVPITRTNDSAIAQAAVDRLRIIYPSGRVVTNTVSWAAGQAVAYSSVKINEIASGEKAARIRPEDVGKTILLKLYNEDFSKETGRSHIYCVAPESCPNSPSNPYWIGERTADELKYGEWTMDLDVITNKVKKSGGYAMVLVGGSCWCPDCAMADHHLFERPEFKAWALEKKVVFGVLDVPANPSTAPEGRPSLLTYVWEKASDAFLTGRGTFAKDPARQYQSGAPYLSRKGIQKAAADEIAKRNRKLLRKGPDEGGYLTADDAAKNQGGAYAKERTGVPALLLLRENGIAARWLKLSAYGPEAFDANLLTRLDEMLDQYDNAKEEANDGWRTTRDSISRRGKVSGRSLSHIDLSDVYRVEGAAVGKSVNFKLTCAADVPGSLKLIQTSGDTEKVLAVSGGLLSTGLEVTGKIASSNCFVVLTVDNPYGQAASTNSALVLSATHPGSSLVGYSITSDTTLAPSDEPNEEEIEVGDVLYDLHALVFETLAKQAYKITNLDTSAADFADNFEVGESPDVYVAKKTGAVTITLAEKDPETQSYKTTYQLWNTGKVGFAQGMDRVDEPASEGVGYVDYEIALARLDGASGSGVFRIWLDAEASSANPEGSIYQWEDDGAEFAWKDGEVFATNATVRIFANECADGDAKLVFRLAKVSGDAALDVDEFTLTVKDDDEANGGKVAISATRPGCDANGVVVAAPDSAVEIDVGRFGGSDGTARAELSASAGALSQSVFEWAGRDAALCGVTLDLAGCTPGSTVQVTLRAVSGATIDSARKYLYVKIADANPPAFTRVEENVEAVRYVPIAPVEIEVDSKTLLGTGDVKVVQDSGTLPPGLSCAYDAAAGKLAISGVATRAGAWSVVYRVSEGERAGMTATVNVTVADPAAPGADASVANPYVRTARTISDVLVIDSATHRLVGVLDVTVPQSGRISAKYRPFAGEPLSFLCESWASCAGGDLAATARDVQGLDNALGVKVLARDSVDGAAGDVVIVPSGNVFPADCEVFASAAAWTPETSAAAWKGYYTVSLPQTNVTSATLPFCSGSAYVTLRMDTDVTVNAGRMSYAGLLPDGKAFSGAATLLARAEDWDEELQVWRRTVLPLFTTSSSDALFGALSLTPYGKMKHTSAETLRSVYPFEQTALLWRHVAEAGQDATECELDAYGSYYSADEDLASCVSCTFNQNPLYFFALTDELVPFNAVFGTGLALFWAVDGTEMTVNENDVHLKNAAAARSAHGLTFTFNRATGVVNGSFKVDFSATGAAPAESDATAYFKGVVMPGWGATCEGNCSYGDGGLRPFISGPCWFADVASYVDGMGRARTQSVKRGFGFSVGVVEGK